VCDGGLDQQLMRCSDGTLRNMAENYCIQTQHADGTGALASVGC